MRVTVTGAAGHIGYALLFRIASGAMLGPDTPVDLRLLEIPDAVRAAEGVAMELDDGAFGLLRSIEISDDPAVAFEGTNIALLVGSRPRGPGMDRAALLGANAAIFGPQGRALNAVAADDVRVLVVANPANTNTLVAALSAPDIPPERFTAMTRLDHNRALSQLAKHLGVGVSSLTRLAVWGNHSDTQYPDLTHALVDGLPVVVDREWVDGEYIPTVAHRGAAIIAARGLSSAASAASAAVDHVRDWVTGTPEGDWTSAGLVSRGEYGVPEGLVCSFPVRSVDGVWSVVSDLALDAYSRAHLDASVADLAAERETVHTLGFV